MNVHLTRFLHTSDNNLMNVPLDPDKEGVEPRYKVRLIEDKSKRLMFDVTGV